MSGGRRLVLDRQHMVQMLSDPEFYSRCPHFLWLRKSAMRAAARFEENKRRSCCGGDFNIMRAVVDAFFVNLKELYAVEPEATESVRRYLEDKKQYAIGQIIIYYRATRKQKHPAKLIITGGARDGSQSQPSHQAHVGHEPLRAQ